jgi:peptide/nickel transport system ATP-binding protein
MRDPQVMGYSNARISSGAAMDARPHRLSGGQRQRVVIARAIACEPDLLIADEPTSSLDVSIQAQILNLLVDLREERGLALVLVSHDLAVLRHMTDTCLIMRDGNVVERGLTEDVLSQPKHEYTRTLVAAHQDEDPGSGTGLDAAGRENEQET